MKFKDILASSAITNIIIQFSQFIVIFYIAALIGDEQYGQFVLFMSMINLFISLTETGVSSYLISSSLNDEEENEFYSAIFVIVFSFVLLVALISSLFWGVFSGYILTSIGLCAVGGLYNVLYIVKKAVLTKSLLFKKILMIEFVSSFISIVIGVIAAKFNAGALSLFLFYLSKNLVAFFYSSTYVNMEMSTRRISFTEFFKSMNYVAGFTLFNIVNYFSRNFDKIIISTSFGNALLGQYGLAYRIMTYPIQTISSIINGAVYPVLVGRPDKIKGKYLESIFMISSITFPMMSVISWYSNDILVLLLGEGWESAARMLKIMALAGALQSVMSTVGLLYQLSGDVRTMNKVGVLNSILILFVIFFFSFVVKNLYLLVIMYLIVYILIFPHTMLIPAKKFNICFYDLICSIIPSLILSALIIIVFNYCSFYTMAYYAFIGSIVASYIILFKRKINSFLSI